MNKKRPLNHHKESNIIIFGSNHNKNNHNNINDCDDGNKNDKNHMYHFHQNMIYTLMARSIIGYNHHSHHRYPTQSSSSSYQYRLLHSNAGILLSKHTSTRNSCTSLCNDTTPRTTTTTTTTTNEIEEPTPLQQNTGTLYIPKQQRNNNIISNRIKFNIPWCIPSYIQFHYSSNNTNHHTNNHVVVHNNHPPQQHLTTIYIYKIAYNIHQRHIAILYRDTGTTTGTPNHHQLFAIAIYTEDTIRTTSFIGRQHILRSMNHIHHQQQQQEQHEHERNENVEQGDENVHHNNTPLFTNLLHTITPDFILPYHMPTVNTIDCTSIFEYDPIFGHYLIIGMLRENYIVLYHIPTMIEYMKSQQKNSVYAFPQQCFIILNISKSVQGNSSEKIDLASKVCFINNSTNNHHINTNHSHHLNDVIPQHQKEDYNDCTVIVSTGKFVTGWKISKKFGSTDHTISKNKYVTSHWQYQYDQQDSISTMSVLPNPNVYSNDHHKPLLIIVLGTSYGRIILLNIQKLHYRSMSCTLSPTLIDEWISYQNHHHPNTNSINSHVSSPIDDWLEYEKRCLKNNFNPVGLGIRSLSVIPELYIPKSLSLNRSNNKSITKIRYRFIWLTINGWILSTTIEVEIHHQHHGTTTTANNNNINNNNNKCNNNDTVCTRRRSKAPYYDGICYTHYVTKPVVYQNLDGTCIRPVRPIWNSINDDIAYPVSVTNSGILWYNPNDTHEEQYIQPKPILPNPDVRVLSSSSSSSSSSNSTAVTKANKKQRRNQRCGIPVVPKLNYFRFDTINNNHVFGIPSNTSLSFYEQFNEKDIITRIKLRKSKRDTNVSQQLQSHSQFSKPTCVLLIDPKHSSSAIPEYIFVGTPEFGLYMIESKTKIIPK
jgi:hypothetical protein